ncbi:MAG: MBL fold metallo-hydrolase [Planctomycetota bacterium]
MRRTGHTDTPASLGIHDRETGALLLVEATPSIEKQVALLHDLTGARGHARRPIDALLITHAHVGHYLGLAHLGREVASADDVPLFVTPRFAAFLRTNAPWSQLVALDQVDVREVELGAAFEPLPGLSVEAILVPHRDEFSDTVAFKIRGEHRTVLFVPDVDGWNPHEGLLERLMDGVDVAYLDGTFYDGRELPGRDLREIPHPPTVDTMRRLAEHAHAHPGSVRFLHLNHTNPLWLDAGLRKDLEARGFALARQGERVEL